MKKNFVMMFTMMILFSLTGRSFAQSPDQLMLDANKLYQEGQYENAIQSFQKILSQGYESGPLYFNLGNAYFRTGKLGYAIFNYEKGLKLDPNDNDLIYNLRIANSRTVDKISELPKLFIISWWEGIVTSLTITGWSVMVILFYLILIASIAVYLLIRKVQLQRFAFMSGSLSLAILILLSVMLFSRINREASTDYGILLSPSYSVKASPDSKSSDAFVIHEGIKFTIEDHVSDWDKIRLVDGKVGWIERNSIGQI
ncbi:MAG: tetratricopeptide repeat protein [Bacteroidetes bacterium]|nr:tetratricopeptide repeat protein [Bacteroidota bacterium]